MHWLIFLPIMISMGVGIPQKKTQPEASRVVICGCARNVQAHLPRVFCHCMAPLKTLFLDYRIILFENDSTDNTRTQLEVFRQEDPKVILLTEENLKAKIRSRTQRLAYARNRCLEYAQAHFGDFDYLIVVDLDDRPIVDKTVNLDTLRTLFRRSAEWDVVSVAGPYYYDIWALRSPDFPSNCWNLPDGKTYFRWAKREIKRRLLAIDDSDFLEVDSSFNGFAIYFFPKTWGCHYDGRNSELKRQTGDDCEHVAFHRSMQKKHGARITITPLSLFGR